MPLVSAIISDSHPSRIGPLKGGRNLWANPRRFRRSGGRNPSRRGPERPERLPIEFPAVFQRGLWMTIPLRERFCGASIRSQQFLHHFQNL